MVPRNAMPLIKYDTAKFQVERDSLYFCSENQTLNYINTPLSRIF